MIYFGTTWNKIIYLECSHVMKFRADLIWSPIIWTNRKRYSISVFFSEPKKRRCNLMSLFILHIEYMWLTVPVMAWSFLSLSFSQTFSLTSLFPGSHVLLLIHATQEKQHNNVILESLLQKPVMWHDLMSLSHSLINSGRMAH